MFLFFFSTDCLKPIKVKKLFIALLLIPYVVFSQQMDVEKLETIYESVSDSIHSKGSTWQFYIETVPIISIADSSHNRMRIMSPIMESDNLTDDLIKACLVANFHTALDIKYAVSDGVLWSVFIHPLKELTEHQIKDAISQVLHGNINFGTTFSSTSLAFPSSLNNESDKENKKEIPKKDLINNRI